MAALIGPIGTVINMNQAVNGNAMGNPSYASQLVVAESVAGQAQIVNLYNQQLASVTPASLTATVMANLFITTAAGVSQANVTAISTYLNSVFAQFPTAKGQIISNLTNILGTLEADAAWGGAAVAFNNAVAADYVYSTNPANTNAGSAANASTFTLTTNIDNVGGSTNTYTGVDNAAGPAGGQTFNSGDTVSSAAAVNITFTGNGNVAADINNTVFSGTMLSAATIQAALFDGVTAIRNAGGALGNTLTVTNGELATTYGISGDTSAAGIAPTIRASNVSGAADTIKYSVAGAGSITGTVAAGQTTNTATLASTTSGIEGISVATSGTNVFSITGSTTLITDNVRLTVTGSGANTITTSALTNTLTYDLSTATGNNAVNLVGGLQTGTTFTGGTGTDTIRIQGAATAANITVTGFEVLRLSSGGTTGSTFFTGTPSFTTIRMDGDGGELGAQTLNNVGSPTAINFVGAGSTALSGTAQQFNTLTINSSWTGSADSVTVNFSNQGTLLTAGIGYTASGAGTVTTLNGIETLTINATDIGTTGATAFTGITDRDLSSLTVTTAGNVTLGTITAAGALGTGALTSINLAGATGTNASSLTIGADTINGALVITGAINGNTITNTNGQQSTDQVIFNGNVGVDNINNAGFTGVVVANGFAGNDILVGGSGADALTGGEGADTITGGIAADSIVLTEVVAAIDRVRYAQSATTDVDNVTGFAIANDIVGYTIGAGFANGAAAITLSNMAGADIGAAATSATVVTFSGTASADGGTAGTFIQLTTGATSFGAAIGASGLVNAAYADLSTAEGVAAAWYDTASSNAVFGFIVNTGVGAATGILNSGDTFVEVTRVGMTAGNYATLAASTVEFF
jgi:hypothetical protein